MELYSIPSFSWLSNEILKSIKIQVFSWQFFSLSKIKASHLFDSLCNVSIILGQSAPFFFIYSFITIWVYPFISLLLIILFKYFNLLKKVIHIDSRTHTAYNVFLCKQWFGFSFFPNLRHFLMKCSIVISWSRKMVTMI